MNISKILIDMDGVLSDFVAGICKAHDRPNPYLKKENHGKFEMDEIWDMYLEEFWEPTNSSSFWSTLPLMPGANRIVEWAFSQVEPRKVAICSTPSTSPYSACGKLRWIDRHFPKLRRQYFLTPIKAWLAKPDVLLIDDNDKNCEKFEKAGGQVMMPPHPWNKKHGESFEEWLNQLR